MQDKEQILKSVFDELASTADNYEYRYECNVQGRLFKEKYDNFSAAVLGMLSDNVDVTTNSHSRTKLRIISRNIAFDKHQKCFFISFKCDKL